MANKGSKTPVSILNEYLIRKGVLPKFDLVMSGCDVQHPTFAYVVQYDEYYAMGEGRSKQEAKHQAARKMLQILNISCEDEYQEDVKQLIVPHENNIGYNAVGLLTEYCKKNCYPGPVYEKVSDVGPSHAKIFTMKCCVSQLNTYGEARTIKEAKHIAAHKMVVQLQQEAGEEPMAVAIPKKPTVDESTTVELPRVTPVYQPQAHLYKDFCNAHLGLEEKSETLTKILNDWDIVTMKNACQMVLDISKEMAVVVNIEKLGYSFHEKLPLTVLENDYSKPDKIECSDPNNKDKVIFITMQLHPPVVGVDSNVPGAAISLLEFLKELIT